MDWLASFWADKPLIRVLDILIVWYVIYRLLLFARGTRAMNLIKGVAVILFIKFMSATMELHTVDWILGQVISWGVVATVVLFQPELRKALEVLGRGLMLGKKSGQHPSEKMIDDLEKSVLYMSKRKIGALLSIEGEDSLEEYMATGIPIDSEISHQLIVNIFIPNTPLHDGAVIISNYRLAVAAGYLPLSDNPNISKELGTRHRAAIGLGEITDALTLVVSEETGSISLVKKDHLHRNLTPEELHELLTQYLLPESEKTNERDMLQNARNLLLSSFKQRGGRS
ncbi:MAG: diadenylate cyclase CdaA [Aerococcaceae bacterium]|nr:diadenylate cyclase CdaA [Aerococcaceae bacterium]